MRVIVQYSCGGGSNTIVWGSAPNVAEVIPPPIFVPAQHRVSGAASGSSFKEDWCCRESRSRTFPYHWQMLRAIRRQKRYARRASRRLIAAVLRNPGEDAPFWDYQKPDAWCLS
jgi:hypothetical protein